MGAPPLRFPTGGRWRVAALLLTSRAAAAAISEGAQEAARRRSVDLLRLEWFHRGQVIQIGVEVGLRLCRDLLGASILRNRYRRTPPPAGPWHIIGIRF